MIGDRLLKDYKERETIKSFDYQWTNLQNAKHLLTDDNWKSNVDNYILDELQVTKEWIRDKSVIDVGCGGGRWSYGFVKLGCQVTATDVSLGPCGLTKKHVPRAEVIISDLFELPTIMRNKKFDIIWCWGVIHHASNPRAAFDTLTKLMHADSLIHVYAYSFDRGIRIRMLRGLLGSFSLKHREQLIKLLLKIGVLRGDAHEWFDALSPKINIEIPEAILQEWFRSNGLEYRNHIPQWAGQSRDLFATGKWAR